MSNIIIIDATTHESFNNYGSPNPSSIKGKWFIGIEHENGFIEYEKEGFDTMEDAVKSSKNINNSKCVYLVTKNADFTEGRGPMIPHEIFGNVNDAFNYIMKCEGIYGSEQRYSVTFGVNIHKKCFCIASFNGYGITRMELK